jgi:CRP-like cAMP-binding protein
MSQANAGGDRGFRWGASFYEKLAPAERKELQYSCRGRTYRRGDRLAAEGWPAGSVDVTILLGGWAKASAVTPGGTEVLLRLYGPGDLIGGEAVISGQAWSESVTALTQLRCLMIPAIRFTDMLVRSPGIDRSFRETLVQRVLAADQQIKDRLYPAETRLARLLAKLAHRSGTETPEGTLIPLEFSQEDLASWIGVSRAAVARILGQLRQQDVVITGYRQVIITDLQKLHKIAEAAEVDQVRPRMRHW